MMLFGQVSIQHLKSVSTNFWNAPVECNDPQFYAVEIVGLIKDVQVISVSFFFIAGVTTSNNVSELSLYSRSVLSEVLLSTVVV
jgi:hypothetical protein